MWKVLEYYVWATSRLRRQARRLLQLYGCRFSSYPCEDHDVVFLLVAVMSRLRRLWVHTCYVALRRIREGADVNIRLHATEFSSVEPSRQRLYSIDKLILQKQDPHWRRTQGQCLFPPLWHLFTLHTFTEPYSFTPSF